MITLPSSANEGLNQQNAIVYRWIEIDGIPDAFGTFEAPGSWFDSRSQNIRRDRILPAITHVPMALTSQCDPLQGGNLSGGSLEVSLADLEGVVTKFAGTTPVRALAADITASQTTLTLDVYSLSGVTYLYIGHETLRIVSVVGTTVNVQRGQCGTTPQAYGRGFPVGVAPYAMANRRVTLYNIIQSKFNTTSKADGMKFARFTGLLKGLSLGDDRTTFKLRVDSLDKELDRNFFEPRNYTVTKSSFSLAPPDAQMDEEYGPVWPMDTPGQIKENANNDFVAGDVSIFKVDDEYIACEWETVDGERRPILRARGVYGSKVEAHEAPYTLQEVMPIVQQETTGPWDVRASWFHTPNGIYPSDHPLMVLLHILLATGGTGNYPGSPEYDYMLPRLGMETPHSWVDVAGIEAAAAMEPYLRFRGKVEGPTNFISFAREILSFCGYYFFTNGSGQFTVRKLRPQLPGEQVSSINNNQIVKTRPPSWKSGWEQAVQEVVFKYGWDGKNYRFVNVYKLTEANIYARGVARSLAFDSKLVGPDLGPAIGGVMNSWDVDAWLNTRVDYLQGRYARPPALIEVAVPWTFITLEVGDYIALLNPTTPNGNLGIRGTQQTCQVVGIAPDESSKTIVLSCVTVPPGQYKYFVPSATLEDKEWLHANPGEWHVKMDIFGRLTPANLKQNGEDYFGTVGSAWNTIEDWIGGVTLWDVYDATWRLRGEAIEFYDYDGVYMANYDDIGGWGTLADGYVLVMNENGSTQFSNAINGFGAHTDTDDGQTRFFPL